MKPVERVIISNKLKLYKDNDEAESIEVIKFKFEDGSVCGFNVVAQKGLYEIGDEAIYIMPDYCVPDTILFESFTKPGGDPKKSRLGRNNRVRAIKFNFGLEPNTKPIYSNGILLPILDVQKYLDESDLWDTLLGDWSNITELLGVTKYEEPEKMGSGGQLGEFPSNKYKTDETNYATITDTIQRIIDEKHPNFVFTIKLDGSSFSMFVEKDIESETGWKTTICSRRFIVGEKTIITGYKDDKEEYHKYYDKEERKLKWMGKNTSTLVTDEYAKENLIPIEKTEIDPWTKLAKESGLYENGLKYCMENDIELGFRGEVHGSGLRGSGNKNNPSRNLPATLTLFGIDDLSSGFSIPQRDNDIHSLKNVSEAINVNYTIPVADVIVDSVDELVGIANDIFEEERKHGRIIEGVVVRTRDSLDLSFKIMNDEYDASK